MQIIKKETYKNRVKITILEFIKISYKIKSKKSNLDEIISAQKKMSVGKNTVFMDKVNFQNPYNNPIKIGEDCVLNCKFTFESDEGEIEIGDRTFINAGTNLISRSKIKIGSDVVIAWGCTLYDHNSHSFDWKERAKDIEQVRKDYLETGNIIKNKNWATVKSRPIEISDKVWIGFGCTILNGVKIGEGAIIGAQSVVRDDVAPWTVVAGNPAVKIKDITH